MHFSLPIIATVATFFLSVTASPTPVKDKQLAARDPHKFHHGVFAVDKRSLEHFRRERIVIRRADNTTVTTTDSTSSTTTTTSSSTTTDTTTSKETTTTTKDDNEEDKSTSTKKTTAKPTPVTTQVVKTVTGEGGAQSTVVENVVVTPTPPPESPGQEDGPSTDSSDPILANSGSGPDKRGLGGLAAFMVAGLVGIAML